MGGTPTNNLGQVVVNDRGTVFPGLFAAGEAACVSVHGANRLGTNSLLDIVVFGKHAGLSAAGYAQNANFVDLPADPTEFSRRQFDALRNGDGKENAFDIGTEMKKVMYDDVGIFRSEAGMKNGIEKIAEIKQRFQPIQLRGTRKNFNT